MKKLEDYPFKLPEYKPTPAPWWVEGWYCVVARNPKVPWGTIGDPEPNYLNVVVTSDFTRDHEIGVGNACLIAAAPDMKKILEEIADLIPETLDQIGKTKEIKDVLDKTNGQLYPIKHE
jgi:hypothetical protein